MDEEDEDEEADGMGYEAFWWGLAASEWGAVTPTSAAPRGMELISRSEANGLVFRIRRGGGGGDGCCDDGAVDGRRGCGAD